MPEQVKFAEKRGTNMVHYTNLPIYKSTLDLAIYFEKIVKNFDRYHKYTIGSDLRNKSREIATQVMRINALDGKTEAIQELVALIEELKLIIRLCKEVKGFANYNSYGYSSTLIAEISRQAEGWLLHSQERGRQSVPGIAET
jgi:hypothetical protein